MMERQNLQMTVSELWQALNQDIDVFICCGSFESRCKVIADAIEPAGVKRTIVASNEDLAELVSENSEYLRKRFAAGLVPACLDTSKPLASGDAIAKALSDTSSSEPQRFLIDISTFTHESLLILLKLIALHLKPHDKAYLAYVSAADYSVGDEDDVKWLSKGVKDVRSVLGYPGEMLPSRPTHLIILVGFEHERAARLIEVFEPNFISLGYGQPGTATNPKHQTANEHFHRLVRKSADVYGRTVDSFTFSCCDPWDAMEAITVRRRELADHNVCVAPMNTKISSVGAALAAMDDESIQLCYAQAMQYNYRNYSIPGDMCHLVDMSDLIKYG